MCIVIQIFPSVQEVDFALAQEAPVAEADRKQMWFTLGSHVIQSYGLNMSKHQSIQDNPSVAPKLVYRCWFGIV